MSEQVGGELERRYRRLLWAYPKAYRDRRGTELITTLLDMAEDGRAPSHLRTGAHLLVSGVRQRFRRPLPWVAALVAAVLLGAFGAAAGTWLGWQTATSVPSDSELRALNAAMTGMPAPAAVYREQSAMKGPSTLVRADGDGDYSAERLRAALAADGWQVTSFGERTGAIIIALDPMTIEGEQVPTLTVDYTATKGDLKLRGDGSVVTGRSPAVQFPRASYGTAVWPKEPIAVRPLTVAGLLGGLLLGWLLARAASRLRGAGRLQRWAATVLYGIGFTGLAVPAYDHLLDTYQVMVYAHGSPEPYVVLSTYESNLPLICLGFGLVALLAGLVVARPRPARLSPMRPEPGR
jgi:hypothetical protein